LGFDRQNGDPCYGSLTSPFAVRMTTTLAMPSFPAMTLSSSLPRGHLSGGHPFKRIRIYIWIS